jgi:hypothetical protein
MRVVMQDNVNVNVKREEALGRALQQIEKAYGKGAIMQLDKMDADFDGISTGVSRPASRKMYPSPAKGKLVCL